MKTGKSKKFSFMIGVSGSTPKPLPPLKPDMPKDNTSLTGKITKQPFKPNEQGC
jgi:hypothetical protein